MMANGGRKIEISSGRDLCRIVLFIDLIVETHMTSIALLRRELQSDSHVPIVLKPIVAIQVPL